MTDLRVAEKLAWLVKSAVREDTEIAFLTCEEKLYWARHQASGPQPTSAIVKLVQGLYEIYPDSAQKLVRRRIYATTKPTEMCRGMVKVAARRLTAPITPVDHNDLSFADLTFIEITAPKPPLPPPTFEGQSTTLGEPAHFMRAVFELAQQVPREKPLYKCSRPIAAILVSEKNEILAYAINTNVSNRTQHAEVNLIQSYFLTTKQGLPSRSTLYTTLKPCRMCAAMIWHMAEDPENLRVFYGAHDPGPQARHTILDAKSPDRRDACRRAGVPHLLDLQLEELL